MRAGIITGRGALGLPSTSSISGNGSLRASLKILASTASSEIVSAISILPSGSRTDQRLSEATQSAAVTAAPSCHFRPSRNLKLQLSLSADTSQLSTICGLISPFSFMANSMSKTCRPKVRVMVAVMKCGSRIVTLGFQHHRHCLRRTGLTRPDQGCPSQNRAAGQSRSAPQITHTLSPSIQPAP